MDQNISKNNENFKQQEQINVQNQEHKQKGQASTKANFSFSFKKQDNVELALRKPRSKVYLELFSAIDMLSATDEEIIAKLKENLDEDTAEEFSQMSKDELLEEIKLSFQEEFSNLEIPIETVMHGVISKCYINGCDCHAIDSAGNILSHFEEHKKMPDELAMGRVAFHKYPKCTCIEVYADCCRIVKPDGEVVRIMNSEL